MREMVLNYLQHIAIGGKTNHFLAENGVTWLDLNEWLSGKLYDVFVVAQKLGSTVRLKTAEDELYRRSVEGFDKPVFHKGEICGSIREYSDTLLTLLLKANDPDKYADRQKVEHKGVMLNLTVEGVRD